MKRLGKKVLASTIIVNMLFFCMSGIIGEFSVEAEEINSNVEEDKSRNFIHTDGTNLKDSDENDFYIKSMGIGNGVWKVDDGAYEADHNEDTYKELHEMRI